MLEDYDPHSPVTLLIRRAIELRGMKFPDLVDVLTRDAKVLDFLRNPVGGENHRSRDRGAGRMHCAAVALRGRAYRVPVTGSHARLPAPARPGPRCPARRPGSADRRRRRAPADRRGRPRRRPAIGRRGPRRSGRASAVAGRGGRRHGSAGPAPGRRGPAGDRCSDLSPEHRGVGRRRRGGRGRSGPEPSPCAAAGATGSARPGVRAFVEPHPGRRGRWLAPPGRPARAGARAACGALPAGAGFRRRPAAIAGVDHAAAIAMAHRRHRHCRGGAVAGRGRHPVISGPPPASAATWVIESKGLGRRSPDADRRGVARARSCPDIVRVRSGGRSPVPAGRS